MNKSTEKKLLKLEGKMKECDQKIASYTEQIEAIKSRNSTLKKLKKAVTDFIKVTSEFDVQNDLTKKAGIKFDKLEMYPTELLSSGTENLKELESKIADEKSQKSKLEEAEKKILELEQALEDAGISNL